MAGLGVLGRCDEHMIRRYVELLLEWGTLGQAIRQNGHVYMVRGREKKDPQTGDLKPGQVLAVKTFPHVRIRREVEGELRALEDRMGFSPAARARLAGSVNPAAAFADPRVSRHFAAG